MLRVIIVDDERLAREGLRRMLGKFADVEIVGEAGRVSRAAEIIRQEKPDAVFLDIRMPGASGFDLLGNLEEKPKIVFVTAYAEHAAQAFEVQAVDYLLKPVRPDRLTEAVNRLREIGGQNEESVKYRRGDSICLRTPERTVIAALKDIAALEAQGDFTRFHIAEQPALLICRALGSYERTLPQPPFIRLSRSLLVNLERVAAVDHRLEARLALRGIPETFVLGRRALARLRAYTG